jgi:peptidoglycan/xylan/chitin deacetylase (PgdA/CDA1 family)
LVEAAPVLKQQGARAVLFVITDLLDQPSAQPWWDRWGAEALATHGSGAAQAAVAAYGKRCNAAKLTFTGLDAAELQPGARRRYLSRAELQALPEQFCVANHTSGHAILNLLSDDAMRSQVTAGHQELASHRSFVPVFAYPCGTHDARVMGVVDGLGLYTVLFATGAGRNRDRLRQKRINLNVRPFSLFAAQCVGLMA